MHACTCTGVVAEDGANCKRRDAGDMHGSNCTAITSTYIERELREREKKTEKEKL